MSIEFSFKRPESDCEASGINIKSIANGYQEIINDYFKKINPLDKIYNTEGDSVTIKVYDLDRYSTDTGNQVLFGQGSTNVVFTSTKEVMCHSYNLKVEGVNSKNYKLFSFYIYGQNNCCGALTVSDTFVSNSLCRRKLGEILQYFKEDLAIYQRVSKLTCTDIFNKVYDECTPLDELKPYLPNTKLLLRTGLSLIHI